MDDHKKDLMKTSCSRCRWVEFQPQPYGSIAYFCSRRQEALTSAALDKRQCREFAH